MFGDQTSFYTGSTEFTVTDVSLPGTGLIPVRLGRRYLVEDKLGVYGGVNAKPPAYQFGDWQLDIPHLHGVFARQWGWISSYENIQQRCTNVNNPNAAAPPGVITQNTAFAASEFWHGNQLYVPGTGNQEMLVVMQDNPHKPTDGGVYRWVTPQQWYFTCLPAMAANNGTPGEAFLARAPDGTRYWFDWAVAYPAPRITKPYGMGPLLSAVDADTEKTTLPVTDTEVSPRAYNSAVLNRDEVWIYPTKIQDRFGNWVTFTYDTTVKQRLTQIAASDGRSITLSYNPEGRVGSVTDGTRTWSYTYAPNGTQLVSVTLPDISKWEYNLGALAALHPASDLAEPTCGGPPSNPTQTARSGTITHPSGAIGTFTFKPTLHGRSYVDRNCPGVLTEDGAVYLAVHPNLFDAISIQSKQIAGPGIPTYQWNFAYGPPNGSWLQDCGACADIKTVTVTGPDSEWIRYTFSNKFQAGEGKLLKTETGTGPNGILRTETATYWLDPVGQPYPDRIGVTPFTRSDRTSEKHAPLLQRQIAQQGATYTWLANGFDQFAYPIKATRSSNPGGYSRTDIISFHHNTAKWVLGQVASSANVNANLVESKTDYDTNALPWKTYAFGKLQQTATYNPDGTLLTVMDGNNKPTTFGNWKRGIPQKITFADTKFRSAVVNNIGGIDSVADENGYKTCYGYDAMGRLAGITYPSEAVAGLCDTSTWAQTARSFVKSGTAVYGLPAGHWEQTVATGNGRQITYFDALWRPMVVSTYEAGNTTNTLSQTVNRYDAQGRPTFVSYPQRSQDAAVYNTWANPAVAPNALGTDTFYDTLGRVTAIKQDSEWGTLTTSKGYLSNADGPYTVITNPRTYQTRTWYQAYDQPNYDTPVEIWHPEATRTVIDRDVFGKPKTLTRRNDAGTVTLNHYYYYDNYQQLCRSAEPESDSTVFAYDAANNLAWTASGLNYPLTQACYQAEASASGRRIDRGYDARNRVKLLLFHDNRGNQTWTYTPDGLPESIVTNNGNGEVVTNAYAYSKRRLLVRENLAAWDALSWSIDYGYNANGHLAEQSWHGLSIDYAPNALGQPTRAGTYATNVSYFPNGAMKQFTYGNGILHLLTQNERGLPERSLDIYQSTHYLDDSYDYDWIGNVASISDGGPAQRHRTMTYDGLDRLAKVVSPMYGSTGASYAYDVLDNLTRVNIGGAAARSHYYCYDAANQLTNVRTADCTATGGASEIGLGYDEQGNLKNKNGMVFTFDLGNRLRSVGNPATLTYAYDAYNQRVLDQTPAGVKYSHYNQAGQLVMTGDERSGKVSEYIQLNGSLVAIRERDVASGAYAVKYQHTDALGSPVAVTDANRVVVEKSEYEPYGYLMNRPLTDGPGYAGHVSDAATGLSYMQQRYYDPKIGGRFLSVDPVTADSVGGNFNRYWYANNNPYKFVDPDGRSAVITYKKDGSIDIQVPMTFKGSEATQQNIDTIKANSSAAYSGTYEINGKQTKVGFQVTDVTSSTPKGAKNEVQLLNGPTSLPKTGKSFVNEVGGTKGEINMASKGIAYGEAEHEMGHFAGADDHYDYETGKVNSAFSGNLMGQLPGTVDQRNIVEMLNNKKNIVEYEK